MGVAISLGHQSETCDRFHAYKREPLLLLLGLSWRERDPKNDRGMEASEQLGPRMSHGPSGCHDYFRTVECVK